MLALDPRKHTNRESRTPKLEETPLAAIRRPLDSVRGSRGDRISNGVDQAVLDRLAAFGYLEAYL